MAAFDDPVNEVFCLLFVAVNYVRSCFKVVAHHYCWRHVIVVAIVVRSALARCVMLRIPASVDGLDDGTDDVIGIDEMFKCDRRVSYCMRHFSFCR